MHFFQRKGWWCEFYEDDCTTALTRKLNFKNPEKIIEYRDRLRC
jgi:hypothetical protein